jgi:hypothetical protein
VRPAGSGAEAQPPGGRLAARRGGGPAVWAGDFACGSRAAAAALSPVAGVLVAEHLAPPRAADGPQPHEADAPSLPAAPAADAAPAAVVAAAALFADVARRRGKGGAGAGVEAAGVVLVSSGDGLLPCGMRVTL